ncbi:glycerate kinase type-2 family protein [Parapedomonas caeni]
MRKPTRHQLTSAPPSPRQTLLALFEEALTAISAREVLPPFLQRMGGYERTLVIALGKGAAEMAAVAAERLPGRLNGLVITRAGHGVSDGRLPSGIRMMEAGHPVPDAESIAAASEALAMARALGPKDRLLMLVSGGGSALMAMPAPGVTLADKQLLTQSLLRSGATISEINCVRKHLSRVKGGRLAVAAAPAKVVTLVISDVPGDDPSFVASGPTVADHTTLADARQVLDRYGVVVPMSVRAALEDAGNETPEADSLGIAGGETHIVACARDALAASARLAESLGYKVTDLGDRLQAEARYLGAGHAGLALRLAADGQAHVIQSGGEATVRVTNPDGCGGRNLEYLLGLAIVLDGAPGIHAIACDTDGIDGTENSAGAIIGPDTLARAAALGLDPHAALQRNESYRFFEQLGDLVVTGPTRTNVNDFRAILIEARPDIAG